MTTLRALTVTVLVLISTLVAAPAQAAPGLTLTPAVGAPSTTTTVGGTGFAANSLVDVYFDTQQVGFVATNGTGAFSYSLTVPSTALPGGHTITAVAHNGSLAAQRKFTVRTNWPQWRGNATGKGNNRFENVLDTGTVGDLDLDWSPGGPPVYSAPVVAGANVYTVGSDGRLRAYSRTTSQPTFNVNASATSLIPPVVAANRVITTGQGSIQARNATTGALVWRANLPSAVGAPVVVGGVVYVVAEGSTTLTNGLYAFDVACGNSGAICTPLWIGPGGFTGGSSFYPEMSAAVGGGRVYARLGNDLVAFAVGCGTVGATCSPVGSAVGVATGTSPTFANNYVYEVEGSSLAVRRPNCLACAPAWTGTLPGGAFRTVTVAGARVYVVQGTSLFVFPTSCGSSTCTPIWSTNTGGQVPYPPTVANGVVYVPTARDVFAYPTTCYNGCPPLWTAGSGGTFSNAPYSTVTISDGKVYSAGDTGLQVYSTGETPAISAVRVSDLRPAPQFAAAERRAERRLGLRP